MVETSRDWSEKLPFALWLIGLLFAPLQVPHPTLWYTGMEAMLPVEIEMGSLRVALEQQIPEADWAQGVDPRGRCMADGFRRKPILRANQCGSAKEGHAFLIIFSYHYTSAFSSHLIGYVVHLFFLILSTICLSHIRSTLSGEPPQFITWRIVTSFHHLSHGHWFRDPWSITTFLHVFIVSPSFLSLLVIHLIPFASYSFLTATHLRSMAHEVHYTCCISYMRARVLIIGCRLQQPLLGQVIEIWLILDIVMLLLLGVASLMCRSDSVVFGLPGSSARSLSLYWMLTETRTWSLPYGAPGIHLASSALLDAWMPSCLSIWEVACAMMDDFMTFVLRTCRAPDAILGHISVLGEIYGSSQRSHVRG
ncbi:hypothetical protein CK203_024380 [Vitis vinifera]|uniref:Uncharacterized protein n=1 Tax=Vitis vinifera TaxID=29760 RepID=A0A438IY63_VITVI|nr:hypothetical protein CK203_024380 [Vitis vinifera]